MNFWLGSPGYCLVISTAPMCACIALGLSTGCWYSQHAHAGSIVTWERLWCLASPKVNLSVQPPLHSSQIDLANWNPGHVPFDFLLLMI